MLSRRSFYAEKQHSNTVLPFGAAEFGIMTHHVVRKTVKRHLCDGIFYDDNCILQISCDV